MENEETGKLKVDIRKTKKRREGERERKERRNGQELTEE